jgi:hypothetical protein
LVNKITREGITTETNYNGYIPPPEKEGSGMFEEIGGWLSDTVGTYANSQRDQWMAREGIANGNANNNVPIDTTTAGDIRGKAGMDKPFYENPYVLAGGGFLLVVGLYLVLKK